MIYLLYGEDTFRLQKKIDKILETETDSEKTILESPDFITLINCLKTDSIFQNKRFFIVRNFLENVNSNEIKTFTEALKNLPTSNYVIYTEKNAPKKELVTIFENFGKVLEFQNIKNIDLNKFIKERVKEEGGEISPLAAERLATSVGNNLWQIEEEIRKLVLYKKDEEEKVIETNDVDLLVHTNFDANIFSLIDAIGAKNTKKASELLTSFLEEGENGVYILTMIWGQFRNIALAKSESNLSEAAFAKRAKVHPFVAQKSLRQAKKFTKEEVVRFFKNLALADLELKSGGIADQVLLRLIIK